MSLRYRGAKQLANVDTSLTKSGNGRNGEKLYLVTPTEKLTN